MDWVDFNQEAKRIADIVEKEISKTACGQYFHNRAEKAIRQYLGMEMEKRNAKADKRLTPFLKSLQGSDWNPSKWRGLVKDT